MKRISDRSGIRISDTGVFEADAIAKILEIDDTNLRDTIYYPYDLVHFEKT